MGWEVARDLEREKSSILARIIPERRQVQAAAGAVVVFFLVFLLGSWLAGETTRLDGRAMVARGWEGSTEWGILWTVVVLAMVFEFMDAAAGMGFGTALTPLLLLLGFEPLQIVPAVMIQQAAAGLVGGFLHREFQNVEWRLRPLSETVRLWLIVAGAGGFAATISISAVYGVLQVARFWIKLYVALLLLGMGVASLVQAHRERDYHPRRMLGFGLLAGFNKGVGGGGFGPVVTVGGLISGVPVKSMLAVTALAEGTVSMLGAVVWTLWTAKGVQVDFVLVPSLMLATMVSAIAAPYLTRVFPERFWRGVVPAYCLVVAGICVWKILPDLRAVIGG